MKATLKNNKNKYQMLEISEDIKSIVLSNGKSYEMNKYTSASYKTVTYDCEISKEDALIVFNQIVGKKFELSLTINSDGTVNTQKVNINGGNSRCFLTLQIPTLYIKEIN